MRIIAIDLGGTNVEGALIENSEILGRITQKTASSSKEAVIDQLCEIISLLNDHAQAVAICIPGWVNAPAGIVHNCPNLPLCNVPLASILEERTGFHIKLENDANCAALGQYYFGGANAFDNILVLTLGTGLGAGVILDRKLLSGVGAAELGHVRLHANGRPCNCGRLGCAEQYLSAGGLIATAIEEAEKDKNSLLFNNVMTPEAVFAWAEAGDMAANAALSRYFEDLSESILNYLNCYGDVRVYLGGGIANAGDSLLIPLNEHLQQRTQNLMFSNIIHPIKSCMLRKDTGIFGAYLLYEEAQHDSYK